MADKTTESNETPTDAGAAPVQETTPLAPAQDVPTAAEQPAAADDEAEAAFRVGTWAGLPNYECNLCPFSTLDKDTIDLHVFQQHIGLRAALEPPRPTVTVPIYGTDGSIIKTVEV
jgi:hypothetical protein